VWCDLWRGSEQRIELGVRLLPRCLKAQWVPGGKMVYVGILRGVVGLVGGGEVHVRRCPKLRFRRWLGGGGQVLGGSEWCGLEVGRGYFSSC